MKLLKLFAASFLGVVLFSACGTSKKATTGMASDERAVKQDICMEMADGNPNRAFGEATNGRLSFAKQYAEGQARAALIRQFQTMIKTATNENDLQWSQSSYNGSEGATVSDEGSKAEGKAMQVAEGVLENVVVIKTSVYQKPNGLYHVYVCVEQQDAPSKMASKIANKVKQQVSDEDRVKMEYQFKKFEESIEKELEKMKGGK